MAKPALKIQAIELRKRGYSYSYIQNKVDVSKGTLNQWLVDIPYAPNKETIEKIGKARIASALVKRNKKLASYADARKQAVKDVGDLSRRDIFMLGLGLYLGEGSKTSDSVRIINSDPKIIRFAIKWFRNACGFGIENFRIRLHLYPDNSISQCLKFWSKETTIPISQFYKSQIDLRINKSRKNAGKLPYGTAQLSVKSNGNREWGVFLARKIGAWMDLVLK